LAFEFGLVVEPEASYSLWPIANPADCVGHLNPRNNSHEGYIEAPSDLKRIIFINGEKYEISVKPRIPPVGGAGDVKPRYGVFNPGESFYPHFGVHIVYDESIQDFKEYETGRKHLEDGLRILSGSDGKFLSNNGLFLKIGGSSESGRLSFTLMKKIASGKDIRVSSLPSQGHLTLR
jgi:hypothetical protein